LAGASGVRFSWIERSIRHGQKTFSSPG
jgi:hypothetical protein